MPLGVPYVYTPVQGDNGPAIRALMAAGNNWFQINGPRIDIDTRIPMLDSAGEPMHDFRFEPVPGQESVIVSTQIGRDPMNPTNPSYAVFDYDGSYTPAGYLTVAAAVGDLTVTVNNGALYPVGQWVYFSDASTNPGAYLLPLDGPMEVRKVVSKVGNVLTLDRGLLRAHAVNVIAAKFKPIERVEIHGLVGTGNAACLVHCHASFFGRYYEITTDSLWRGRAMLLVDNGGIQNYIADSYCYGFNPVTFSPGEGDYQVWGVAYEGQWNSVSYRSGGERCGAGHTMNYCIDTVAYDSKARLCTVPQGIYTGSIRTGHRRYFNDAGAATITSDCVECFAHDRQPFPVTATTVTAAKQSLASFPERTSIVASDIIPLQDELGAGYKVPFTKVVFKQADGRVAIGDGIADLQLEVFGPNMGIDSGVNRDGNFHYKNTGAHWISGMLGAPGSVNWVLFDASIGVIRMSVSKATGDVTFNGKLLAGADDLQDLGTASFRWRRLHLTQGVYFNNILAIGGVGAAIVNPSGGAVIDAEARAAIGLILDRMRAKTPGIAA